MQQKSKHNFQRKNVATLFMVGLGSPHNNKVAAPSCKIAPLSGALCFLYGKVVQIENATAITFHRYFEHGAAMVDRRRRLTLVASASPASLEHFYAKTNCDFSQNSCRRRHEKKDRTKK